MTPSDPRADLVGRLRQALTAEDAEHAVEIVVGAGWRPDGPLPPLAELVTREDMVAAMDAHDAALRRDDSLRAALECYGRRLLARRGRPAPQAELRRWLDSRPAVVRVDGVDYLSMASIRAFADEQDVAPPG